jgi:DNA-binding NarL/FixJ family response regulator
MSTERKRRVVLVDDDRIVLEGLKQLFEFEADLEVCGTATSAEEAIEVVRRVASERSAGGEGIDAIVVDLILGEGPDGIQLTKLIKTILPDVPVLMLSGHDESLFAERALTAGTSGYLMKDEAVDVLFEAIRRVLDGRIWLSEGVWTQLLPEVLRAPEVDVDARERCVLTELRAGNVTSHGIASRVNLEERTVLEILEHLRHRTGLATVVMLALYAEIHDLRCPEPEA